MSTSRIYRVLRLITLLQGSRRYTADELAEELEVSRRTVFRDLNMLELAHIPYYFDRDSGGYRISRHFFLPPVNLTLPEALAVLVLTGRLRGGRQVPLLTHGTRAAVKLESVLPESITRHVGSVIGSVQMSLPPGSPHEDTDAMFEELAVAITGRRVCRIVYLSFHEGKQIRTRIHPLRLVFHGHGWYVIAFSTMHREVRTFKMIRIRKLTATGKEFTPPEDVLAARPFGEAWSMIPEGELHDVHLHFSADVAANVAEVQWHASQRVEWNDDGSIELFVRIDGLGEIAWWILGYGERAEVVSPPALRKRIAAVAAKMVSQYAGRPGKGK